MRYIRTGAGQAGRFWGSTAVDSHRPAKPDARADIKAERAQICLNCTKAHCSGTKKCFDKTVKIGVSEDDQEAV